MLLLLSYSSFLLVYIPTLGPPWLHRNRVLLGFGDQILLGPRSCEVAENDAQSRHGTIRHRHGFYRVHGDG